MNPVHNITFRKYYSSLIADISNTQGRAAGFIDPLGQDRYDVGLTIAGDVIESQHITGLEEAKNYVTSLIHDHTHRLPHYEED